MSSWPQIASALWEPALYPAMESLETKKNGSNVLIKLTVVPGFEKVLLGECKEKLGVSGQIDRGHVLIEVQQIQINDVLNLKGADRIYLVIYPETGTHYPLSEENGPDFFKELFDKIKWIHHLKIWCQISNRTIPDQSQLNEIASCKNETEIKSGTFNFRVECSRKGNNHKFTSKEAAAMFGAVLCDAFHWPVNLKEPVLVIFLDIKQDSVSVAIPLTLRSLHRRNIFSLGPHSLRNTVAYNMLRKCSINTGDFVCDLMCGGASISIEGALNWVDSFQLCGENHPKALERASDNISHIKNSNQKLGELELIKWDATRLPLRDNILNVIVTDLPFGKRCGTKSKNTTLYPAMLKESARVCVRGEAIALFLTKDIVSFNMAMQTNNQYWKLNHRFVINLGGLAPTVHLLKRTNNKY